MTNEIRKTTTIVAAWCKRKRKHINGEYVDEDFHDKTKIQENLKNRNPCFGAILSDQFTEALDIFHKGMIL